MIRGEVRDWGWLLSSFFLLQLVRALVDMYNILPPLFIPCSLTLSRPAPQHVAVLERVRWIKPFLKLSWAVGGYSRLCWCRQDALCKASQRSPSWWKIGWENPQASSSPDRCPWLMGNAPFNICQNGCPNRTHGGSPTHCHAQWHTWELCFLLPQSQALDYDRETLFPRGRCF